MSIRIRPELLLKGIKLPRMHLREGNPNSAIVGQSTRTEDLTPEANLKRLRGALSARATVFKQHRQEIKVSPHMKMKAEKRERAKLRETVAREAREIQELGRKSAEGVMRRLAEIAEFSPNETAAIAAAQVILDRAYGKANQTNTNLNVDANGKETDISQKELDARIGQALKRIEEITGGKTQAPKSEERLIDLRKLDRDPNSTPLN